MPNVTPTGSVWSADQIASHGNAELARKQAAADRLSGTNTAKKKADNAPDKDMFMKLMLAQLKYQNPLEPTDTSQFVNQTAQMNMVEQLTKMTQAFELTAGQNNMVMATNLLGQPVQYDKDGEGELTTDVVIGIISGKEPGMRLASGDVIPLKAVQGIGYESTDPGAKPPTTTPPTTTPPSGTAKPETTPGTEAPKPEATPAAPAAPQPAAQGQAAPTSASTDASQPTPPVEG